MGPVTIVVGISLVVVGIVGYVSTGSTHPTALIPAGFGAVFVILGALALKERMRKHAMHAAATIALLGFFATVGGVVKFLKWQVAQVLPDKPDAVRSQALMAMICLAFVILCINSFIAARRRRQALENQGGA